MNLTTVQALLSAQLTSVGSFITTTWGEVIIVSVAISGLILLTRVIYKMFRKGAVAIG